MYHRATLLDNRQVLVTGGYWYAVSCEWRKAELYNPVTGLWTSIAPMSNGRAHHTTTKLNGGVVLIAGGEGPQGSCPSPSVPLASAELFVSSSNSFTPTGC